MHVRFSSRDASLSISLCVSFITESLLSNGVLNLNVQARRPVLISSLGKAGVIYWSVIPGMVDARFRLATSWTFDKNGIFIWVITQFIVFYRICISYHIWTFSISVFILQCVLCIPIPIPGDRIPKTWEGSPSFKSQALGQIAITWQGIDFFCGVPDSLLKSFCAYVTDHTPASNAIITANEGCPAPLGHCCWHLLTPPLQIQVV